MLREAKGSQVAIVAYQRPLPSLPLVLWTPWQMIWGFAKAMLRSFARVIEGIGAVSALRRALTERKRLMWQVWDLRLCVLLLLLARL